MGAWRNSKRGALQAPIARDTLYLTDRVMLGGRLWWPGVSPYCRQCRTVSKLILDAPSALAPGRLYCLAAAHEPYEVLTERHRPAPKTGLARPRVGRPPKNPPIERW